ncbi:hypothetical protein DB88DRAFT_311477 [Papiliotrema laurentii]|uniref:Uncharacterized protein n=1 Tax=Papiliotrema laurentii TaxID=5418 RepID=A0AAD9D0D6_PAPLA|nr:hypothetical protein DB88DRAFT_311477 [Papiliotrema laurentii]
MADQYSNNSTHSTISEAGQTFTQRMNELSPPQPPIEGGTSALHGQGVRRRPQDSSVTDPGIPVPSSWYLDLLSEQNPRDNATRTSGSLPNRSTHVSPGPSSKQPDTAVTLSLPLVSTSPNTATLRAPVPYPEGSMEGEYRSNSSLSSTRAQAGPPVPSEGGTAAGVVDNRSAAEGPEASTGGQKRIRPSRHAPQSGTGGESGCHCCVVL